MTPSIGAKPDLATAPSDLIAMFVSPPSLLPGDGFSVGLAPNRAVYRSYQFNASRSCCQTCGDRARRYRIGSAPNNSGTSVRIDVPPRATSRSLATPSAGFAETPEKASDPPHFMPSVSSLTGTRERQQLGDALQAFTHRPAGAAHLLHADLDHRFVRRPDAAAEMAGERGQVCFLAPQLDDERTADVRMPKVRGEHVHRVIDHRSVRTAASLVVRNGADAIDVRKLLARPISPLRIVGDQLRLVTGAHARRDHQDEIARAHAAVGPPVAVEMRGQHGVVRQRRRRSGARQIDRLGIDAWNTRLHAIGIDPVSAVDAARDGKRASVLNEKCSGRHVPERDTLAGRDRFDDVEIAAGRRVVARRDRRDGERHVVAFHVNDDGGQFHLRYPRVAPPSTGSAMPVMKLAAGDARKRIASAISSDEAMRPIRCISAC